ncbi:hypothetical protein MAPG_07004 [Magnaporthiopsis poae ATCC 64411]|uniref:Uncharacterized protein n=1 Tax=Magnaporthiopsis poae (strain ATCC 64411 / 73-15) TaxID=644358 RepID=A0A0C4E3K2_MAGP6|nr:hypothetical protein MAPG_07004 [Magnaporthiopsis poae ATCC 64411]
MNKKEEKKKNKEWSSPLMDQSRAPEYIPGIALFTHIPLCFPPPSSLDPNLRTMHAISRRATPMGPHIWFFPLLFSWFLFTSRVLPCRWLLPTPPQRQGKNKKKDQNPSTGSGHTKDA